MVAGPTQLAHPIALSQLLPTKRQALTPPGPPPLPQVMHERVQHAALQLGMVPLQRLSAQHAASLSQLSGAVPLACWQPASSWTQLLGVVGCIHKQVGGGVGS